MDLYDPSNGSSDDGRAMDEHMQQAERDVMRLVDYSSGEDNEWRTPSSGSSVVSNTTYIGRHHSPLPFGDAFGGGPWYTGGEPSILHEVRKPSNGGLRIQPGDWVYAGSGLARRSDGTLRSCWDLKRKGYVGRPYDRDVESVEGSGPLPNSDTEDAVQSTFRHRLIRTDRNWEELPRTDGGDGVNGRPDDWDEARFLNAHPCEQEADTVGGRVRGTGPCDNRGLWGRDQLPSSPPNVGSIPAQDASEGGGGGIRPDSYLDLEQHASKVLVSKRGAERDMGGWASFPTPDYRFDGEGD